MNNTHGGFWLRTGILLFLLRVLASHTASAEPLHPQPTFSSQNGELNLIVTAKPRNIVLGQFNPEAWVYEVCERTNAQSLKCKARPVSPYGGVKLALKAKDTLRVHFINGLPELICDHATHAGPDEQGNVLLRNPTNIHTHGLIVEPRRATHTLPTYGDYVYVEDQNPANTTPTATCPTTGIPQPTTQPHAAGHSMITDQVGGPVDYTIDIPPDHPDGLFWFHPHVHGLALNQVSAGLSGSITTGDLKNYVCDQPGCTGFSGRIAVNYLMLKDTQVLDAGTIQAQQAKPTDFCNKNRAASDPPRQGFCPEKANGSQGKWFHTINGQVYPEIEVKPAGQIWRITNAAGSRSYHLQLVDPSGKPMIMQVLSVDGIAFDIPTGTSIDDLRALFGHKIDIESCPDSGPAVSPNGKAKLRGEPVCATGLSMMPSARAEVWVARRDPAEGNKLMFGKTPSHAVLRTTVYDTGAKSPTGDSLGDEWPEVDLASVTFDQAPSGFSFPMAMLGVKGEALKALAPQGALTAPPTLRMTANRAPVDVATARSLAQRQPQSALPKGLTLAPQGISPDIKLGLKTPIECTPLPKGHRRRIFFGSIQPGTDSFGLGYEEIDKATGQPVDPTNHPAVIVPFNPDDVTVCIQVPLFQPANAPPPSEEWELVNLTPEDHNFHIHQTRFQLITGGAGLPPVPASIQGTAVLQDNVPVPHGTADCDGSIASWRKPAGGGNAACASPPVVVRIPFKEIGDFVYHCHILEHEDGGMMARIRVVPAPLEVGSNAANVGH